MKFRWTAAAGDFAYPLEVSSSLFRAAELLSVLFALEFTHRTRSKRIWRVKAELLQPRARVGARGPRSARERWRRAAWWSVRGRDPRSRRELERSLGHALEVLRFD